MTFVPPCAPAPRVSNTPPKSSVLFHAKFGGGQAKCKAGAIEFSCAPEAGSMRMLGPKTLLGKWTGVAPVLGDTIYFVLQR